MIRAELLRQDIDRFSTQVHRALDNRFLTGGSMGIALREMMIPRTPIDTGRLRRSLEIRQPNSAFALSLEYLVYYARYVSTLDIPGEMVQPAEFIVAYQADANLRRALADG